MDFGKPEGKWEVRKRGKGGQEGKRQKLTKMDEPSIENMKWTMTNCRVEEDLVQ